MATPAQPRPIRTLLMLGLILLAMVGSLVGGTRLSDASITPKLALDLEGGTQIILTPKTSDGSEITDDDLEQAISIIRQRVDASGVAEAEITRQGQENIVVALPGQPTQQTLDLVRQSALLRFRPVLSVGDPAPITPELLTAYEQQEAGTDPTTLSEDEIASLAEEASTNFEDGVRAIADSDDDGVLSTEPLTPPTDNSDDAWVTEQLTYEFFMLDCTSPESLAGGDTYATAEPAVACATDGTAKYLLGPADLEGTNITQAASGLKPTQSGGVTNQWIVTLDFDAEGADLFESTTGRLSQLPAPKNQFAIVLDGQVISAPGVSAAIPGGSALIEGGGFDQQNTAMLANQLSFGSLPLNFEVQSESQISATLGMEQLERGILAGLIGLGLVALYMLWQYQALGFLSLASLALAGFITYLAITLLSWTSGYRLSLAGVAGLIVAIGITADSFIVYFERIRDEIREGRALHHAVDFGWERARRTILASDSVNLLAAVVLYFLAVGGVRGFAFTLGLTTLVDILVVFLFTHPMMQLLIRTRFFGEGKRWSGLELERLGVEPAYKGRGRMAAPSGTATRPKKRRPDAGSGGTIAERKAAAAAAEREADELSSISEEA